jgi:hypothetical protein
MGGLGDMMSDSADWGFQGPANAILNQSSTGKKILDPMDIYGERAENTSDTISRLAVEGAQSSIDSQEEMRQTIEGLMAPYRQRGTNALADFTAQATGGQTQTQLSPEYMMQRTEGIQNINRGMGALGRRLSTSRDKKMGNFLGKLGQEESSRQYGRNLDAIKAGMGAVSTMGAAGQNASQNVGSMYGNLGNAMNANAQNYGAARNQSMQQAGNAMSGLGQYLAYNSGGS